jgi:DNA replication protein DnaC
LGIVTAKQLVRSSERKPWLELARFESFPDWTVHRVQPKPATMTTLDRFLQTAEIIEITGKSYRLKDRSRKDGK